MVLGKKGIVFTLIALLLAGLFILIYSSDVRTPLDRKAELYSMRVTQLRYFSDTYEQFLQDAVSTSMRESLNSYVRYLAETKNVPATPENLTCRLVDLALTGSVHDSIDDVSQISVDGSNLFLLTEFWNTRDCTTWDCQIGFIGSTNQMDNYTLAASDEAMNVTFGILQEFSPQIDTYLDEIIIFHNTSLIYGNVSLGLYSMPCNSSLTLMEEINLTFVSEDTVAGYLHFIPQKKIVLEKEKYYAIFLHADQPLSLGMSTTGGAAVPGGWMYHDLMYMWSRNITRFRNYSYENMYGNKVNIFSFMKKMKNYSQEQLGIDSDIIILNISIEQDSAWTFDVVTDAWIMVADNFSNYTRRVTIHSPVDLNGVYEPLWGLKRSSLHIIKRAPLSVDVWSGSNVTNLTEFIQADYYWERYVDTPSYWYRMLNWTNASGNFGIETIINDTNEEIPDKSFVDWHLLSNDSLSCAVLWYINVERVRNEYGIFSNEYVFWDNHRNLTFDTFSLVAYNLPALYWNTSCPS